ncbi:MAG: hypothetical protein J7518_22040 [Nocardioidaceae bacterium]|nr:hypothetical protein [Nocardioidaceae bacterium]
MTITNAWHDIVHDLEDEMHDLATITRLDAARQAYLALWATCVAFPLLFGIDRFATFMNSNWDPYVATWVNDVLPGSAHDAVAIMGVIELVIAALVLVSPRVGGDLFALWMLLLAADLFALDNRGWIAVGCIAVAILAFAMARMSTAYHHHEG